MDELLELLVKSIVDTPDAVVITKAEAEKTIIFEVKVAEEDVGKVIGKHGRIINAIRTVVKASAVRDGKKVTIELLG